MRKAEFRQATMIRLIITSLFILIPSCRSGIRIENLKQIKLSYQQLPYNIKDFYTRYHREAVNFGQASVLDDPYWHLHSTDSNHTIEYKRTVFEDGIIKLLIYGTDHRFYIDGTCYRYYGAAGQPYILDQNCLYFSLELNLHFEYCNIDSANFMRVDLVKSDN